MAKKKKSGKKRKVNPLAKKAMLLVKSKGVSLKEAWRIVKGGKASSSKPKKKRKAKARKAPKKARKARAKAPKKKRKARAKAPKKKAKAKRSSAARSSGGLPSTSSL